MSTDLRKIMQGLHRKYCFEHDALQNALTATARSEEETYLEPLFLSEAAALCENGDEWFELGDTSEKMLLVHKEIYEWLRAGSNFDQSEDEHHRLVRTLSACTSIPIRLLSGSLPPRSVADEPPMRDLVAWYAALRLLACCYTPRPAASVEEMLYMTDAQGTMSEKVSCLKYHTLAASSSAGGQQARPSSVTDGWPGLYAGPEREEILADEITQRRVESIGSSFSVGKARETDTPGSMDALDTVIRQDRVERWVFDCGQDSFRSHSGSPNRVRGGDASTKQAQHSVSNSFRSDDEIIPMIFADSSVIGPIRNWPTSSSHTQRMQSHVDSAARRLNRYQIVKSIRDSCRPQIYSATREFHPRAYLRPVRLNTQGHWRPAVPRYRPETLVASLRTGVPQPSSIWQRWGEAQ